MSRHDPRRWALGVLSSALGGGMSSRLFQRIREERGLAYSVYSFSSGFADAGQFGVYAGCQPGKAEEVLALMVAELDSVAAGTLSDDEIERGKGQMRGGIVLGLEDAGSRMTRIGKSEVAYGDIIGLDEVLRRKVDEVTRAVTSPMSAADILRRPRCLTVVGPVRGPRFRRRSLRSGDYDERRLRSGDRPMRPNRSASAYSARGDAWASRFVGPSIQRQRSRPGRDGRRR